MKILIVEDEEVIRKMVRRILEMENYQVTEAVNGVEAMLQLSKQSFDLVITDIVMPEQEGIETIRGIKTKYPNIKILAVSGGGKVGPENYLSMAKMMGADLTLQKPFQSNDLVNCVKELIT